MNPSGITLVLPEPILHPLSTHQREVKETLFTANNRYSEPHPRCSLTLATLRRLSTGNTFSVVGRKEGVAENGKLSRIKMAEPADVGQVRKKWKTM
jgi:hypothetical protein